jgi:small subunit ribosomal protein S8
VTDPIADFLTRIRNASNAKHASVDIPASRVKFAISKILLDEGYIKKFKLIKDNKQGIIKIELRYLANKVPVITGIKKISKPGLRNYSSVNDLPKVIRGLGVAIVSTSKGIMSDRQARLKHVGGEVFAFVW